QGCNPELSVLRTSVSCLRHTAAGVLEMIQLDGELNPGNSGGPIVDGEGRVVGMTTSRLRAARIGFAIPGERLRGMLRTQRATARRQRAPVQTNLLAEGGRGERKESRSRHAGSLCAAERFGDRLLQGQGLPRRPRRRKGFFAQHAPYGSDMTVVVGTV